jgi:hypothetical protein
MSKESANKISFLFDPLPACVFDLVCQGKLTGDDAIVVVALSRWRKDPSSTTCWTTNKLLVKRTGFSKSKIQCSLRRLAKADVVHRIKIPKPDPLDPRNKTGYTFLLRYAENGGCEPRHLPSVRSNTSQVPNLTPHIRSELTAGETNGENSSACEACEPEAHKLLGGDLEGVPGKRPTSRRKHQHPTREIDQAALEECEI